MFKFLRGIFGCSHSKTTFPLKPNSKSDTYVVCLSCGQEFQYNWDKMKLERKPKNAEVRRHVSC